MEAAGSCGVRPSREAELASQGWVRQFTANEPRLSEAVAEYQALGFEVHLEPFDPAARGQNGCTACFDQPEVASQFKIIYTRLAQTSK
jgi:hypothetical protein